MDCPGSPWIFAQLGWYYIDPVGCPGCRIKFDYWYRPAACGVYHDVQLGNITMTLQCLSCGYSTKDIVQFAIDKMIRDNPIPKPGNDTCDTFWRALNSSCWGEWDNDSVHVFKPCRPAQCCWKLLEVCGEADGQISYTTIDSYTPDPEDCLIYPYPCQFTCEGAPEPPSIQTGRKENVNAENGFKTIVYPNPSDGWVNIKFVSDSKGAHSVEVFDIKGNLVISKLFEKNQSEMFIQLNMNKYPSGNYRYVIKNGNVSGISGSFNVTK
jgi:hypothetical protein